MLRTYDHSKNRHMYLAPPTYIHSGSRYNGDSVAQNKVGLKYLSGDEVDQNYKEAYEWFYLAAIQNNDDAQFNIALLYANAGTIGVDRLDIIRWYLTESGVRAFERTQSINGTEEIDIFPEGAFVL